MDIDPQQLLLAFCIAAVAYGAGGVTLLAFAIARLTKPPLRILAVIGALLPAAVAVGLIALFDLLSHSLWCC